ncbi:MAG: hypothetical protein ACLFOY_01410 [Desulfatibacillaceae bacterium]
MEPLYTIGPISIGLLERIGLITINATMVVQLVSFLIFLFVMNRLMFRPLRATLAERDSRVEGAEKEAEQAHKDINRMRDQLAEQEAAARIEAAKVRNGLEDEGNRKAQEILDEARSEMQKERQAMTRKVEQEIAEARKSLEEESRQLSIRIMEQILDRGVS